MTFAVKWFKKPEVLDIKSTLVKFKTERDNLKRSEEQKHRHLVSFHTSFTDKVFWGFITSPVAESNLKSLLEKSKKKNVISKEESESLSLAVLVILIEPKKLTSIYVHYPLYCWPLYRRGRAY